jgi:pimeloyl-ACP methyl ester carboxylesterase
MPALQVVEFSDQLYARLNFSELRPPVNRSVTRSFGDGVTTIESSGLHHQSESKENGMSTWVSEQFGKQQLRMAILALGGGGMGDNPKALMEPLAEHVEGGAIEDCGHYVMEEQPDVVASQLLEFFSNAERATR